ncbi:hypothetical protein QUB70_11735 [Microcoleus sp. A003_D6]|uniref:hypothetical protein n=1 Tax=Microcoleus sp. A003_D6 TaxID=3055266 RepID=UPI002FD0E509
MVEIAIDREKGVKGDRPFDFTKGDRPFQTEKAIVLLTNSQDNRSEFLVSVDVALMK